MLDLRILKAKVDLMFNINLFRINLILLRKKQSTPEVEKKIEQATMIVTTSKEIIILINELKTELEYANRSFHSLHIEYMKAKQELEKLKPKYNDLKNVEPNLNTIKIGNKYFDIRS